MSESPRIRRASIVWGVFLVVVGIALLGTEYVGADVFRVGWPLFIIVVGMLFFVAMFTSPPGRGIGYLAIPACVILTTGLVLGAQNLTDDWESWAYAWALVAPTSVGLGLLIAGAYERSRGVRIAGAVVMGIGAALFVIAEWFTVRVAKIGGPGLGDWFGYVFPAAIVAIGISVVVLGTRRAR